MSQKIKKIVLLIKRDGLRFTFKRIIAYIISHSPLSSKMSFTFYKKTKLLFSPTLLTYSIFASPLTRANDIKVFEKHIKLEDTVIDIGANIGSLSLVAATIVGEKGRVIAFEPAPKFAEIVKKNIKLNKFESFVQVEPVALGAESKKVYLNEDVADDTTSYVSNAGTEVEQNTLDEYTENISKIDFLKIDVEGYEAFVLRGAEKTLQRTNCIYIEFITDNFHKLSTSPDEVIKILEKDFSLYHYQQDNLIKFNYQAGQSYALDLIGLPKASNVSMV